MPCRKETDAPASAFEMLEDGDSFMGRDSFDQPFLTENELFRFQRRFAHYFMDYEYRNKLQAKEVAEKIGISAQKYSYVKSEKVLYPKFIKSLDYLAKVASLKGMTITEFIEYIEGRGEKVFPEDETKMAEWKKTLLHAFEPLTSKTRTAFLDLCSRSIRDGKRKMEALVEIVNILQGKDVEAIEAMRDALRKVV